MNSYQCECGEETGSARSLREHMRRTGHAVAIPPELATTILDIFKGPYPENMVSKKQSLSKAVAAKRKADKLSMRQLAKQLEMSQPMTISNIENNGAIPNVQSFLRIMVWLGELTSIQAARLLSFIE